MPIIHNKSQRVYQVARAFSVELREIAPGMHDVTEADLEKLCEVLPLRGNPEIEILDSLPTPPAEPESSEPAADAAPATDAPAAPAEMPAEDAAAESTETSSEDPPTKPGRKSKG